MTRSRHEGPSLGKPCAYSMVRRRTTYVKYLVYLTACEVGRLGVGKRILDRTRWGGRLPCRQAQPQTESNKHRDRHAIDRSLCRSASEQAARPSCAEDHPGEPEQAFGVVNERQEQPDRKVGCTGWDE